MAEFPALPLWTDAYLGDTRHLSTLQHGIFLLLLICMWRSKDCTLPDNDKMLARMTGLTHGQWLRNAETIRAFFKVKDGKLSNSRLSDELNAVRQLRNQRVFAGRASALKRKNRGSTFVDDPLSHRATPTPTPTPTKRKNPSERKNSSDSSVGARSEKSLTRTALKGSRWGSDREVPEDWHEAAAMIRLKHGLPAIDTKLEADKFTTHWSSATGTRATKLDWRKTWINWILKAEVPRGRRNGTDQQQRRPTARENFVVGVKRVFDKLEQRAREEQGDPADASAPVGALLPPGPATK